MQILLSRCTLGSFSSTETTDYAHCNRMQSVQNDQNKSKGVVNGWHLQGEMLDAGSFNVYVVNVW